MYSLPTRPKTVGGVLDDTFRLYRASLSKCWPISLISGFLSAIPAVLMATYIDPANPDPNAVLQFVTSPTFWLSYLVLIFAMILFYVALLVRVNEIAHGEDGSVATAIGAGVRLIPRSIGASILYALAIGVGFLLLVVPGLIWMVSLMMSGVVIVTEGAGATASLSRSRQLVKGNWWRTAALMTMAFILAYVLLICVELIAQAVGALNGTDAITLAVATSLVSAVLSIFVLPLYSAAVLSIYFDLKLRKEGDDLSERVGALANS